MMTIKEVEKALEDRVVQTVAAKTGLPYSTVYRISRGKMKRPAYLVIEKLSEYFEGQVLAK